jgi:hypothetical protein
MEDLKNAQRPVKRKHSVLDERQLTETSTPKNAVPSEVEDGPAARKSMLRSMTMAVVDPESRKTEYEILLSEGYKQDFDESKFTDKKSRAKKLARKQSNKEERMRRKVNPQISEKGR